MNTRVKRLERWVLVLGALVVVQFAVMFGVAAKSPVSDEIRCKRLVVVDKQGRERITLEAPHFNYCEIMFFDEHNKNRVRLVQVGDYGFLEFKHRGNKLTMYPPR